MEAMRWGRRTPSPSGKFLSELRTWLDQVAVVLRTSDSSDRWRSVADEAKHTSRRVRSPVGYAASPREELHDDMRHENYV